MHTTPSHQPAAAALAAAIALSLLAASPASRAASVYAVTATTFDTRGPQTVCQDVFCSKVIIVPPAVVTDAKSDRLSPEMQDALDNGEKSLIQHSTWSKSVDANSRLAGASGTATARIGYENGWVSAGVGARASIDSVFHSQANASLLTTYIVDVILERQGLAGDLVFANGGAVLAVDFQHQTTGQFTWTGQPVPGAQATFGETVRVAGTGAQTSRAEMQGQASVTSGPVVGAGPTAQASGAWSPGDFHAPLLGDDDTAWTFNHFHTLPGVIARFFIQDETMDGGDIDVLVGRFEFTLEQQAGARFTDPSIYRVGGGTSIDADFAHTSRFGLGRVYDPTGRLDLSGVRAELRFRDTTAVPEPASLGLVLAALGLGAWRRRAAMGRPCPKGLGASRSALRPGPPGQ
jgi:PEP-CTERM motif